nr:T9SS type A sorting domain-containing protein [Bacteroidota bacterium]
MLSIANTVDIASASITGMKGEKIVFINVQQGGTKTLKCDEIKNGFYFLNIVTKNNATYSKKFFLNKE